jgi:hypothetical protein
MGWKGRGRERERERDGREKEKLTSSNKYNQRNSLLFYICIYISVFDQKLLKLKELKELKELLSLSLIFLFLVGWLTRLGLLATHPPLLTTTGKVRDGCDGWKHSEWM